MASQALLDQFWQALNNSKSFQALTASEQAELRTLYANVSDEQLAEAMEEIKKDMGTTEKLEEEKKKNIEEQLAIARDLKATMKKIERDEMKENAALDKEESTEAAESLLEDLNKEDVEKSGQQKKRKKFLGIF